MSYEDYMELLVEEVKESVEVEAMEEEYGSETVENYMGYGV